MVDPCSVLRKRFALVRTLRPNWGETVVVPEGRLSGETLKAQANPIQGVVSELGDRSESIGRHGSLTEWSATAQDLSSISPSISRRGTSHPNTSQPDLPTVCSRRGSERSRSYVGIPYNEKSDAPQSARKLAPAIRNAGLACGFSLTWSAARCLPTLNHHTRQPAPLRPREF